MTTTPARIQRRRTAGWRAPAHSTYVGRPTRFGNPYRIVRADHGLIVQFGETGGGVGVWPNELEARRYATEAYRVWINQPEQADQLRLFRALLHGRDLTCWCPLPEPGQPDHCHGAVLLLAANDYGAPPGSGVCDRCWQWDANPVNFPRCPDCGSSWSRTTAPRPA